MNRRFLRRFREYDSEKPEKVTEISGLLGVPINGAQQVEVPNRNGFVYVRLRNNTSELIQAYNEKVSPVYGLPVLVVYKGNRYEVIGRDSARYSDWGSFSAYLPRHGSQHSLNFEDGQGGDVTWVYSRQFMPFATIPSGTDGAGTVFIEPHVYRASDASWNYVGNESSPNFLPAKPSGASGTMARMMLLVWDLSTDDPLIVTGSFLAENLTGTSSILSSVPTITNSDYVPLAAIRLVSGTQSLLWDNIYDMRQFAGTSSAGGSTFAGVDQIGIYALDNGVAKGTGTWVDFGDNLTASRSGTVLRIDAIASAPVQTDGFLTQDEGSLLGTGTTLNFVGAGVTATISGTVFNVNIPGGAGQQVINRKTRTENRIGTGTFTPFIDYDFTLPIGTGQVWAFDGLLLCYTQNNSADLSVSFTNPRHMFWGGMGTISATETGFLAAVTSSATPPFVSPTGTDQSSFTLFGAKNNGRFGVPLKGVLTTDNLTGDFNMYWGAANGTSGVTMLPNSYLIWTKLY